MILRFKQDLCNTVFPNRFERMDDQGNIEMIRLVTGTNEVLEAKQDKNAKPKDFRTGYANLKEDGEVFYQVEITDKAVINYLKKTPYWDKFIFVHDPIAKSEKESEEVKKEIAVLAKISTIENTEMLQLGYALIGKEALQFGAENNYEGLRVKLFKLAGEDSEVVSDILNNPNKQDFLTLALAFAKGIILEGDAGNSVVWGDQNGAKICTVQLGDTPLNALMSFLETSEGQEVRQMIGLKIENAGKEATAKAKPVGKTPTKPTA